MPDAIRPPIPMLDLASEVDGLWDEVRPAVERVLRSGQFIGGPEVQAFEAEVAAFLGVRHAVGLNSGTDALVIALEALGVGPGDEVITTPFSFFATAEAAMRLGATPLFGDIDPVTLNLDPETIPPLLSERTKAILPVHLFGLPAKMARIVEIGRGAGVPVLEDAAQAFGAVYSGACAGCDGARDGACDEAVRSELAGRKVGALGTAAAFSFYPTKTLGAYGDAGMLTTDDDELAAHARRLRNHGSRPDDKYVHDLLGHNSRLDALQAAVLRIKLRRLPEANAARRRVAGWYRDALADAPGVVLPPDHPDHVFHQFTVQVPAGRLEAVRQALGAGIAHQRFYPLALSAQPVMGEVATPPVVAEMCDRVVSLPIHPGLGEGDVRWIADRLCSAL
ncbi:MAG: DegT/DnrJ/EryC1/StrS family aminotransferase [Trueperaceae bacterium]|nr:DegT/DnrJ/EryC1/StrS family aminotransferase [Trueperaceae bacterium]